MEVDACAEQLSVGSCTRPLPADELGPVTGSESSAGSWTCSLPSGLGTGTLARSSTSIATRKRDTML